MVSVWKVVVSMRAPSECLRDRGRAIDTQGHRLTTSRFMTGRSLYHAGESQVVGAMREWQKAMLRRMRPNPVGDATKRPRTSARRGEGQQGQGQEGSMITYRLCHKSMMLVKVSDSPEERARTPALCYYYGGKAVRGASSIRAGRTVARREKRKMRKQPF